MFGLLSFGVSTQSIITFWTVLKEGGEFLAYRVTFADVTTRVNSF